jgi:tetratricopeptide (TPR) repeat protein
MQEFIYDDTESRRVMIQWEDSGGIVRILLDGFEVGSFVDEGGAGAERDFSLPDGSVLQVRFATSQAEVWSNGRLLTPLPAATEKSEEASDLPSVAFFQQALKDGAGHLKAGRSEQALAAFEQAIQLDATSARAYTGKGDALNNLKRLEEALAAYDQAIACDPTYGVAYGKKGVALFQLQRYSEALTFITLGIERNPDDAAFYINKGLILRSLGRYEEALAAYDEAIRLNPKNANAYAGKGNTLYSLQRAEEGRVS